MATIPDISQRGTLLMGAVRDAVSDLIQRNNFVHTTMQFIFTPALVDPADITITVELSLDGENWFTVRTVTLTNNKALEVFVGAYPLLRIRRVDEAVLAPGDLKVYVASI